MNRRNFIKVAGTTTVVTAAAAVAGCKSDTNGSIADVPLGEMTYRTNPKTNDKVSLLGYGCMRWPTLDTPDSATGNILDQEAVNRLVAYAHEHGVNLFDSAPVYGQGWSERTLGVALSSLSIPRDSYFLSTKLSNMSAPAQTFERSREMYQQSREALKTDVIDYYHLHNIGSIPAFYQRFIDNGILEYLLKEREEGRIRNLGFSFHGNKETFDFLMSQHETYHWDFTMIQMNYSDWTHANPSAEYMYNELVSRGIPVFIMEPLLGGRLSSVATPIFEAFKEREPDYSAASWAFRFCGSHEGVLTTLSGMTYMEHLQDNLKTFSPLKPLSEDDYVFLEEIANWLREYPLASCNNCLYCMPCPYGIDIAGILTHYNKCVSEENLISDKSDSNYKKARRAFLIGYDRTVEKLRQANHCSGCNTCSPLCPQRIDIPAALRQIDEFYEQLRLDNTAPMI